LSTLIVQYKCCGNGCVHGLQVCGLGLGGCGLDLGLGGCGLVDITESYHRFCLVSQRRFAFDVRM